MALSTPSPRWLVGVTGTNGKTTTTTLIGHVLGAVGWSVATVTTVETRVDGALTPTRDLRVVLDAGCRAVVQETTSWSLERGLTRVAPFDAAVFTNLTHDHLDQHGGSFERYLAAKAQLFASLGRSSHPRPIAVLRADDAASDLLAEVVDPRVRIVRWGWGRGHVAGGWVDGELELDGQRVVTPLVGRHMAENVLAALALVEAMGVPRADAVAALASFTPVRGRFERVGAGPGPVVVVDYAHTPDALARTLQAARARCAGQLWVVFGCGGGRDVEKRAVMGDIAASLADRVIVTTDNPRREPAEQIADQVVSAPTVRAALRAGRVERVADRARAIHAAVRSAGDGDWVLIAGKGHETTQELADGVVPFDDRAVAAEALTHRGEVIDGVEPRVVPGGRGGDRVGGVRGAEGVDV